MSILEQKDISLLLDAGFTEEDLGLIPGGKSGVTLYETPGDYFAREIIENACECGECNLLDEILPPISKIPYDTDRKELYGDIEYPGNDDPTEGVKVGLRPQVEWLKTIKLGPMSIWQKRESENKFKWKIKNLNVTIPNKEKIRMLKMCKEYQKILWTKYAKAEWMACWQAVVDSMYEHLIDGTVIIETTNKKRFNLLVLSTDNLRKIGYNNLPTEARWITMMYFEKVR